MVARRIEIRPTRLQKDDDGDENEGIIKGKIKYGNAMLWVVALTASLMLYHCYDTYV